MAVVGLAAVLIVVGLLIAFLSSNAGRLSTLFWWVGIILAVAGLVLLVTPVLILISGWVNQSLGQRGA